MLNIWYFRIALIGITAAGYLWTVARTVSLWDCGEFIACIHTLGIAHPPGTPFFMILGKTWEQLLFFLPHIAFRINLLSAFCSVLSCLLLFEITCYLAVKIKIRPALQKTCGLMAGLLLAFSDTFWFNGVEAEVYAFSIAEMLLGIWIIIKWEERGHGRYSPWILLLVYVSFLGVGVHMYSMLLVPFLLFFIGLKSGRILPGRYFYFLTAVITGSFVLCFLIPDLAEQTLFLFVSISICLVLLVLSIKRGEIRDISYWTFGLFLCTVITLTKPFLVTLVVLIAGLCLLALISDGRNWRSWIYLPFSLFFTWALYRFVPLSGTFALSLHNSDMWICLLLGAATLVFCVLSDRGKVEVDRRKIHFYSLLVILTAVGYSTYLYIPVRSHLNPVIDENNPENWTRLQAFIERKQYGSESMLVRMFNRRGLWSSQFGYGHNMGYFRYHSSQFLPIPPQPQPARAFSWFNFHRFLAGAMLLLSLWILAEHFKKNKSWIGLLLFLYAVCSVGLVLYMNFADANRIEVNQLKQWKQVVSKVHDTLESRGMDVPKIPNPNLINDYKSAVQARPGDSASLKSSRGGRHLRDWEKLKDLAAKQGFGLPGIPAPVHAEVRVRDYFFTPAFVMFILLFSLALFIIVDNLANRYPAVAPLICRVALGLALTLWLLPFSMHFKTHTRAYDFIASDFAWNILQSCPPDAILFTNGDNDTFPLWYMQEVEKVRKDITVINFSLANTDWYAKQFTYQEPTVKFPSLEKDGRFPAPRYIRFSKVQRIPLPGDTSLAFEIGGRNAGMYIQVQDHVLLEAVMFNYPRRPICFTLSTPKRATMGLEKFFQTRGLVQVLSSQPGLNLAALDRNILETYRYRYLGDDRHVLNATSRRITGHYRELIRLGHQSHIQNLHRRAGSSGTDAAIDKEKELVRRYRQLEEKLFGKE